MYYQQIFVFSYNSLNRFLLVSLYGYTFLLLQHSFTQEARLFSGI